jgi:hypothetical protein
MNRFKQVEGEGEVWKEPAGPEIADLEGEEFEDTMALDLGDELNVVATVFETLGLNIPWAESEDLDVRGTQKLATKLKPLDWAAVQKKGVDLGEDAELAEESWERFRAFVVDAARSCNGIEWQLEDW